MLRKIFFVTVFIISYQMGGQIIYSDNFDQGINSSTAPAGYTTSLNNDNLRIVGNGDAGAYAALQYTLHNNGNPTSINLSSNPKLYIKVKGTEFPSFRIDLVDNNGYTTNLNPSSVSALNNYDTFEIDYSGKFTDGGYGGACGTSGTCVVNPSSIESLLFFVNDASGGYNGTIDIEWLSFGAPFDNTPPASHDIRYNQVGYFSLKENVITIASENSFSNIQYTITDASDNVVLNGTSGPSSIWNDADQHVASVDISSITAEGDYKFATSETEITFTVANNPLNDLADAAFKYYYYNRASSASTAAYGGAWTWPTGIPDTNILVHSSAASSNRPTGTVISAPKGWYDAGDYNKYVVNSGISTYTLLAAFEHYNDYYEDKEFNIPESGNNLPDILDEVIWNLDWMLDMQDRVAGGGDGGVYHKLTAKGFSGQTTMPASYNLQRYVVQKSTAAALNLAAVAATASRIFANFNSEKPGYSARLLAAAREAYTWAKNNPNVDYNQPSDISTGVYGGDGDITDEFQWAAVELFITTGENQYKNDINESTIGSGTPFWGYVDPLALMSIGFHEDELTGQIDTATARGAFLDTASQMRDRVEDTGIQISLNAYDWGSNGTIANQIVILIRAYEITEDESYLNAAYKTMDYLLGRNGVGKCFVSGFGDNPMLKPHHRLSEGDGVGLPVPGMLAGGPHTGQQDGCAYPGNENATSYLDDWCSYSTNEVTINWNAPLVYAVNALKYYQDEDTLSTNDIADIEGGLVLYPNPTKNTINFNLKNKNTQIDNVSVYDIQGKKLLSKQLSGGQSSLSVEALSSGVYFAVVEINNEAITKKFIKQ